MIWSLTSLLEIRVISLGLGNRSGMFSNRGGNASSDPTMDVASVLGTPLRSEVDMMLFAAYKKSNTYAVYPGNIKEKNLGPVNLIRVYIASNLPVLVRPVCST